MDDPETIVVPPTDPGFDGTRIDPDALPPLPDKISAEEMTFLLTHLIGRLDGIDRRCAAILTKLDQVQKGSQCHARRGR